MYRQLFVRIFGGAVVYITIVFLLCVATGHPQEEGFLAYAIFIFWAAFYGAIITALFYHNWGILKYSKKNEWIEEEMMLLYQCNQSDLYLEALQKKYESAWSRERKQFYLIHLAEAHQFLGEFQKAEELLKEVFAEDLKKAERGYYYCIEAWNSFFLGEQERACDIVEQQKKLIRYAGYGQERRARVQSLFVAEELAKGNIEKGFQIGKKALQRLYFAGDEKYFYLLYAGYHMKQQNYDAASLFLLELCVGVNLPYIQQQLDTWIQQWEAIKGEPFPKKASSKQEARGILQQQIAEEVYTTSIVQIFPAAIRCKKPMKYNVALLVLEALCMPNICVLLLIPLLLLA